MSGDGVRVSVVVPTCNRSARLLRLLDGLARQEMTEPFEVVVVDDASNDDTLERLEEASTRQPFPLTVLPSAVNTGPAGARNRGWQQSRGEIVAFIDDDCVPDPGWLAALAAGLDGADIAVGRTRPPADQVHLIGPFSAYLDIDHDQSYSTCNIAYRRDVLLAMEGFDGPAFRFPNGEDTDLGLRAVKAGFRDHYAPDALVWHDVGPSSFGAHVRRLRRLDGIVTLVSRHPEARQNMNAGLFLRSVDKAVLIAWAAGLVLLRHPRRRPAHLFAVVAVLLYVWQFDRSHYRSRTMAEWATAVPLGFVSDSYAVLVMIHSSARNRTLLL